MYTVQSKNLFDSNLKINRQLDIGGKYIDFCILQLLEDKYTYKQFQLETFQFKITNINMDTQIYKYIDRQKNLDRYKEVDRQKDLDIQIERLRQIERGQKDRLFDI